MTYKNKKQTAEFKNRGQCDNWDQSSTFFVENAACYSNIEIYGDTLLGKGQVFDIDVWYESCGSECSEE